MMASAIALIRRPTSWVSLLCAVCVLTGVAGAAGAAGADDKADKVEKAEKTVKERGKTTSKVEKSVAKTQGTPSIPPSREAAAISFAQENHAELASLLEGLKKNAPKEYQAALQDLDRAVEKLAKIKERSPERHEYELADWKMTSRIRLLAARLTMSSDPAGEAELRAALRERFEFRLAAQRADRDRMQARVTKLDQQIEEMSANADAIVEKQFSDLRKSLPAKPAKPKPKKPANAE